LAALGNGQGSMLGKGDKPASPGDMMSALGSGASGLEGMVMGMVYPGLKGMLEASIRRVTVKVTWREGSRERELEVTQFLTRPQEGQLGTADMLGLPQLNEALGAQTGGATTPSTGTTTGTTTGATK
jgi:general secretion pathway protein I